MNLEFHKNHSKWFVTPVMQAVRRYGMLAHGDRVAVGLSGGKDSVTLLYILWYLRRYTRLVFDLSAIHVRISPGYDSAVLRQYCEALGLPYLEATLEIPGGVSGDSSCSICARLKRGAAAQALASRGIGKLAYGHHADDAAETLLMNILQNRKLGSFSPRVAVDGFPVIIVRPMIYLTEETVASVHRYVGLPRLDFTCPSEERNIRRQAKEAVRLLEKSLGIRSLSRRVVGALENVDETNLWEQIQMTKSQE